MLYKLSILDNGHTVWVTCSASHWVWRSKAYPLLSLEIFYRPPDPSIAVIMHVPFYMTYV